MREFAKAFYESPAWRRTRAYILKRDAGLCVHCGEPGVIVHHKIELTPRNIDDPAIALGEDNLETVCRRLPTASLSMQTEILSQRHIPPGVRRNRYPVSNRASILGRTDPGAHMRGG